MKFLWTTLALSFPFFSLAQSQSGSDILQYAIANLPACALTCTIKTVSSSPCELTNLTCIENDPKLLQHLSGCVKASCTIREALIAKKFLEDLMGKLVRDSTRLGTLTCLIIGGVAVLAYILRVIARLPTVGGNWGLDDWAITASIIIIIPLTICAYVLNQVGLGKDMWQVPFDNITKVLEIFYFTELLYLAAVGLTKISVLLFYLRIFPQQGLRRIIYVTMVFCVLYIIAFVVATALQCLPIRYSWERWDGIHKGKCMNLNADAWASAAVNIALDLVIMILPLQQVRKLAMSRMRRFGVMIMFLGGIFVTIVSVLRLRYLVQFSHSENVTWDYMPIGIWSAVETHVGVIVACLPAIRSLQRSIRDRLFPKPATSTTFYEDDTTKVSSKKRSHRSRLSTLVRSKMDEDDFKLLDEYEMKGAGVTGSTPVEEDIIHSHSHGSSLNRSFGSKDDIRPLGTSPARQEGVLGGIVVQKEYSVDRGSLQPR